MSRHVVPAQPIGSRWRAFLSCDGGFHTAPAGAKEKGWRHRGPESGSASSTCRAMETSSHRSLRAPHSRWQERPTHDACGLRTD